MLRCLCGRCLERGGEHHLLTSVGAAGSVISFTFHPLPRRSWRTLTRAGDFRYLRGVVCLFAVSTSWISLSTQKLGGRSEVGKISCFCDTWTDKRIGFRHVTLERHLLFFVFTKCLASRGRNGGSPFRYSIFQSTAEVLMSFSFLLVLLTASRATL